jgi:hypothetical protein
MKKSYQIIEPAALGTLLGKPKSFDFTLAILSWLIDLVRAELRDQLDGAQIELIRAEYHGAYPAIGIHYDRPEKEDLGPLVEATLSKLLQERTGLDFASWVVRADADWRKLTDDLLGAPP